MSEFAEGFRTGLQIFHDARVLEAFGVSTALCVCVMPVLVLLVVLLVLLFGMEKPDRRKEK